MKNRFIYILVTLLIGYGSIYVYDALSFHILDHRSSLDPVIEAMREMGKMNAYLIMGAFVLLSQIFLTKIIQTRKWEIIATLMFFIGLEEAFFEIAFGMRAEFGTTWTNIDIRFELLYHVETFIILFTATLLYYCLILINTKLHIEKPIQGVTKTFNR